MVNRIRWGLIGLSSLALALSAFLSWHYLAGGSVIGCSGGSPCEEVLSSRWSTVAGVLPVSGLAVGAYLAILIASLSIGPATPAPVRRLAWSAMLVLAGAIAGSAVWFIVAQKWLIGAFCPFCMATHITGLLLAVLVFWQALGAPASLPAPLAAPTNPGSSHLGAPASLPAPMSAPAPLGAPASSTHSGLAGTMPALPFIRPWPVIGLALLGLSFAAILAACQIAFTPPALYRSGQSQENLPTIDPHTAPLVGPPDARYLVTLLFDYKCSHCQQLHFMLDDAVRRYGGKLAFALCPAPLNTQCNPYVPRDVDEFKDSCELAKIALSVWVARRDAFPAFNRWMFSLESGDRWRPRSLDAARAKAVELVGQAKFEAARIDPWIDRYLQTCVRIYGDTGSNAVPKLVFGSRWVTPKPNGPDDLVSILHDSLAVPTP